MYVCMYVCMYALILANLCVKHGAASETPLPRLHVHLENDWGKFTYLNDDEI